MLLFTPPSLRIADYTFQMRMEKMAMSVKLHFCQNTDNVVDWVPLQNLLVFELETFLPRALRRVIWRMLLMKIWIMN